jgi:hypothetical protein
MSGTTNRRLAGIATMTINGDAWDVVSDLAWRTSKVKRETLSGQSRVEGFGEMPQPCYIEATLRDRADANVSDLNALTDATIVVQQANGKTIEGDGMWQVGEDLAVNTQEGTFKIRFEGSDVDESAVTS